MKTLHNLSQIDEASSSRFHEILKNPSQFPIKTLHISAIGVLFLLAILGASLVNSILSRLLPPSSDWLLLEFGFRVYHGSVVD
ncbi:hypothetical protein L2E82_17119 [Cichorium intybus]|uniref:Uncharacterized protein n=1 Tax=Cichorium intybus TaxID=13427 RepID=A0ACB9F822_CICIN|nr:hypothetical protein L2E82_17119 [Cichorium intybus]